MEDPWAHLGAGTDVATVDPQIVQGGGGAPPGIRRGRVRSAATQAVRFLGRVMHFQRDTWVGTPRRCLYDGIFRRRVDLSVVIKTPGLLRACGFHRLICLRIPPGTPRISIRTMPATMLASATLISACTSAASLSSSGRTARVGLAISSRAIRGERAKGASPVRLVVRAAAEDDVLKVRSIPSPRAMRSTHVSTFRSILSNPVTPTFRPEIPP